MAADDHIPDDLDRCLFCRISSGREEATVLLHQDDDFAVFNDHRPAAEHHLLVTPRKHISDVRSLTLQDLPMLKAMVNVGLQVLQSELDKAITAPDRDRPPITIEDDVLLGFHRPPFNTVSHLHLHVIHPRTSMSFLSRLAFKPNTWWFQTAASLEASL